VAQLKTLLRGARLVDPTVGVDGRDDLLIEDGTIAQIGPGGVGDGVDVVECDGLVVLPGLVDTHVHLREPGREDEETVESGTRAAARGGFTAVCAMPNTTPACDTGSAVRFLRDRAAAVGVVRVHPVGALTAGRGGERLAEIGDMVAEGAVAVSDDGDWVLDAGLMRIAMDYVKGFSVPVVSHCEDPCLAAGGVVNEGVASTRLGLPGWPAAAEEVAVARDIRLAELTGCRLHVAHLSTRGSIGAVRAAKERGLPVTCEVTPHHLLLDEDDIVDYDTNKKMNPPLRTAEDREALVEGLVDGTVDCIATDHAPHAPHEKESEFELAPFGTTGLETALPLAVTHLVSTGTLDWSDLARLMSHGPREAFGLDPVGLEEGSVADITVVDPGIEWTVSPGGFESRSGNSAFLGASLVGGARHVLVAGEFVTRDGKVVA
jgi:dihydroorotase